MANILTVRPIFATFTNSFCYQKVNWISAPSRTYHIRHSELQEFRKIIDEFIGIAETIVGEVEQEKSQAIAAQNLLKSMAKQREAEQQDIQVGFFLSDHFEYFKSYLFPGHWFRMKPMRKRWNWNS